MRRVVLGVHRQFLADGILSRIWLRHLVSLHRRPRRSGVARRLIIAIGMRRRRGRHRWRRENDLTGQAHRWDWLALQRHPLHLYRRRRRRRVASFCGLHLDGVMSGDSASRMAKYGARRYHGRRRQCGTHRRVMKEEPKKDKSRLYHRRPLQQLVQFCPSRGDRVCAKDGLGDFTTSSTGTILRLSCALVSLTTTRCQGHPSGEGGLKYTCAAAKSQR